MTTPTTAPPGPGFVTGIRLATGVHHTDADSVAQLLAYHLPPRHAHETTEQIRDGMREFADALRLGPSAEPPPFIGHRIRLRRDRPWLDYGDDAYHLSVAAAPSWVQLAAAGRPVRICVLLEPLASALGREQAAIAAHMRHCLTHDAVRWGTTYHA